jgi:hypothetical protein
MSLHGPKPVRHKFLSVPKPSDATYDSLIAHGKVVGKSSVQPRLASDKSRRPARGPSGY